ncbi:hypothetical protein IVB38_02285 [Bradyrhizobium sp. 38]|uniref:hypothetical protein n=1 Tax=unclassified Bradyrhizobium TaxID=2631580 RepID=UPI001FF7C44B|nr:MULTISPECIES: hypothetical protein [unclassified Bradyrhizobium]MCK1334899.1 hypothetical protein [Bradyrhizobium sp. 38]MCK1779223.1 hypothetical protein [Bradyrhizobium sp. 132]
MAEYRLYRFDKDGHIQGPPVIVDREDDDAAVTQAKQYVDGFAIQVWDRARCVAVLPSAD